MSDACDFYTLSDVVNQFMMRRGNRTRKYFASYLSIAADSWREIFKNTLFTVRNVWLPIEQCTGDPYPFVKTPKDSVRFIGLFVEDECGNDVPLYYENKMNVLRKPSAGACQVCGGNPLADEMNNFSVTTTPIVINGATYYERVYMKYCDGAVYEYREVPTYEYKQIAKNGDYNTDYNSDYSIAAYDNFQVVIHKSSKLICNLQKQACGCPAPTPENETIFLENCGCHKDFFCHRWYCDRFMNEINPNCRGQIHFSEDGKKLYIRQSPNVPQPIKTTGYAKMRYQTSGANIGGDIILPEYSRRAFWGQLNYDILQYKLNISPTIIELARQNKVREDNDLVIYLNQFSMERLGKIQDAPIRY